MKQPSNTIQKIVASFVKDIDQLAKLAKTPLDQSWAAKRLQQAQITSSLSLNQSQKQAISSYIKSHFDPGLKINYSIDKSIIAGLIIRVGNKVIDASIKNRLEKLRESMFYV
ncbi:MAG: ATP synthase F1 subunit delta [Patescibacteria group bacterium]|nr:ATP synthase F1 subunit delta [Patescibacteria group bacterium]